MSPFDSNSLKSGSHDPERHKPLCQNGSFLFHILVNYFKFFFKFILFALFLCFCSCCQKQSKAHPELFLEPIFNEQPVNILTDPNPIPWYRLDTWSMWILFGNDDDGIYGEYSGVAGFDSSNKTFSQAVKWWLRNPLHNFCFYVIGSAQKPNQNWTVLECSPTSMTYFQDTPKNPDEIFPSLTLALNGSKPFFRVRWAYNKNRKGEIYFGWRERGNFGIKCQIYGKRVGYQP